MEKIKLTFYSGVGTVTGANFLLETPGGSKILIDCGMLQGEHFAEEMNAKPFPYDPATVQALVVTHAHLDHVGRIPKLVKEGFKGVIYSTPQTKELAELVLNDAVGILAEEARHKNNEPLYGAAEVARVFPLWKTLEYHQSLEISAGASIFLKDAGHILGSAMVEVKVDTDSRLSGNDADGNNDIRILFTGDLGNSPASLLCDTETVGAVDYLVTESTYGDKNHGPKEQRAAEFERIIKEAMSRGGTLVIPAFSIDRTQVLLYELNNMAEEGRIPSVPIFVDSPMAIKATNIYKANAGLFNERVRKQIARGDDIFAFPKLEYAISQNQSQAIERVKGAKIILAGSGMSVGGRVVGHEESLLPDPKNTVLLVGYQTPGSLGRKLADGQRRVSIRGKEVKVNARIEELYGYSAHKDCDHLLEFVSTATDRLKQTFVTMGEPKASMFLAQKINDELGIEAIVPEIGFSYVI